LFHIFSRCFSHVFTFGSHLVHLWFTFGSSLVQLFTFQHEKRADPEKKVVFLSQVLPSPTTLGYLQLSGLVLEKLNGREIHNLQELAETVDRADSGDLVFEFTDDPGKLVLGAAEVRAVQEKIGKDYNLPALRRL
jgi:hypothetical protein